MERECDKERDKEELTPKRKKEKVKEIKLKQRKMKAE